jgi:hypothetical protein
MLASLPDNITPAFFGMVVIILLQLSQFFFAWRKDMRANDSVRKQDLDNLRDDLMAEIDDVADDLKDFKTSIDRKQEEARKESSRARDEIHNRITESALKLSALVAGQETMTQTMISLSNKVDRALIKTP